MKTFECYNLQMLNEKFILQILTHLKTAIFTLK